MRCMYEDAYSLPTARIRRQTYYQWVCSDCCRVNTIDSTLKAGDWDDCHGCGKRHRLTT